VDHRRIIINQYQVPRPKKTNKIVWERLLKINRKSNISMLSERYTKEILNTWFIYFLQNRITTDIVAQASMSTANMSKFPYVVALKTLEENTKNKFHMKIIWNRCDFSDCVFWRLRLLFKKVPFQIASKFYWRLFLLFKKVNICLLLIFITRRYYGKTIFFIFSIKSRRSRSKASFFKKQIKSSKKNATWKRFLLIKVLKPT
jgi:hypothetical protein